MLTSEERLRALFGNLRNHPWDIYPDFKISKEDAEVLLNATKEMQQELLRVQAVKMSP